MAHTWALYPCDMVKRLRPVRVWDSYNSWDERGVPADESLVQVQRVREWIEATREVLGPVSIPDVVVRYGEGCPNAFIHQKRVMLGSGDGVILGDFSLSLAIFAHEVGHWTNPKLRYRSQAGAVSEHLADVVGVCVQRAYLGRSDWRIGDELFLDGVSCLRDMSAPGSAFDDPVLGEDQQVGHMTEVRAVEDNRGGIHYYSGVLSKAFTVFAEEVGDAAALAVWQRVRRRVGEFIDFDGFARIAIAEAGKDGLRAVAASAFAVVGLPV